MGQNAKTECLPIALGNKETEMEFVEYEDDMMSGFTNSVDYKGSVKDTYIEGGEMDVLEGIDFETLDIYCIIIENNKGSKKAKKSGNI